MSASVFDRCAGASSDGFECQFTSTDAFYYQLPASINKRERPLANLRGANVASHEFCTPVSMTLIAIAYAKSHLLLPKDIVRCVATKYITLYLILLTAYASATVSDSVSQEFKNRKPESHP